MSFINELNVYYPCFHNKGTMPSDLKSERYTCTWQDMILEPRNAHLLWEQGMLNEIRTYLTTFNKELNLPYLHKTEMVIMQKNKKISVNLNRHAHIMMFKSSPKGP